MEIITTEMPLKSKKILFLFNEYQNFGIRKHFATILEKQQALILVGTKINPDLPLPPQTPIEFYPINFQRTTINPFHDFWVIGKLFILCWRTQPDLIISFMMKPSILLLCTNYFYRRSKILMIFTGLGFVFHSKQKLARILKAVITPFLTWRLKQENHYLATLNQSDQKFIQKLTNLKDDKILLLSAGEGVDIQKFKPISAKKLTEPIRIVALMRLLYEKGIIELLGASEILKTRKIPFALNIYGETDTNPNSLSARELVYYQSQNIANFLGFEDAEKIYNHANIVVLPSYHEGLPMVLLEAASCALPIVATNIGGCREICLHEKTGLLVRTGDALSLANALEKLILNQNLQEKYGKQGRKHIQENFTKEISAQEFLALIQKII